MNGYSGRLWQCPYFRWDERQAIHCEAGCVAFPVRPTYLTYASEYCCDNWRRCTLARALERQYDEEEDNER